jgi:hypothetical protein
MVDNVENATSTGTWSIANGKLTISVSGGGQAVYNIEAESSAPTLIWSTLDIRGEEKSYSRKTWSKKQ